MDLLAQVDLLAEGEQEPQDLQEPMGCRAEWGHRGQWGLRVLLVCLAFLALMDPQVFLALSLKAVEIFCVQPSAPLVPLALPGCLDLRVTQGTKETRGRLGKMAKRVTLAPLVLQVYQALWVCRVHVV